MSGSEVTSSMEIIRDKKQMRDWTRGRRKAGERVGLVPTMGSLHEGHLALIREAKARADRVVVSIYVNPGQFAVGEDFDIYPRNFESDLVKLQPFHVDVVFNPIDLYVRHDEPTGDKILIPKTSAEDTSESREETVSVTPSLGNGHETWIRVERLEKILCGRNRAIFFRGVATIVTKLFNIIEPDVAIFGKKDFQQWRIICKLVQDLDLDIEIVGGTLVREHDGLAMSSRNVRLSPEEREQALSISRALREAEAAIKGGERNVKLLADRVSDAITAAGGRIDYVEIVERTKLDTIHVLKSPAVILVAAHFGSVRLLDNVEVEPPREYHP